MRLAIEASANLQCRQRSKQGGDVEQRHWRPDTVILIEFPAVPPQITGFAHHCLMAEETALRICGGARGIKDHCCVADANANTGARSEEHTSELQSLMRISYAVLCLN